jgi:hypothetical protein
MIDYAFLREECDYPVHLSQEDLENKIYRAQETLRMLMGDDFYQDFLTNFKASTLSSVYETLFPYIKQYIAWQANEFFTTTANYKLTAAGFVVHTSASAQPATDVQMANIIKEAKYNAQYYKELLVGFMKNHSADYPLYDNCCCDKTGNAFQISAVKNKHKSPQPYGTTHGCTSYKCR